MPQFSYKARTVQGEIKLGKLNAADKIELASNLRKQSLILISIEKGEKKKGDINIKLPSFLNRVSAVDKMLFTRNLGVMLRAGLSFSRALSVLAEQTSNTYFKEIIMSVQDDVQKGNPLGESMEKFPKAFDELFVNMIKVGDAAGNLEEVLNLLYIQIKKSHELVSKVRGAMMYPAVIIFAMVIVGTLMMVFVLPTILTIFTDMDVELPLPTRMLIFVSNTIQNQGLLVLVGFIIFFISIGLALKNPKGKRAFDYLILHTPTIKGIVAKMNMARFARTLSSMIASGVSIVDALETVSGILGNSYYRDSIKKASINVQKGMSLSEFFGQYGKLYHPMLVNMIEVGEETGTLEDTLRQVAEFYEDEVEQVTENISSIIEPILMLLIGGAVGLFAVSIIQPMYGIMGKM